MPPFSHDYYCSRRRRGGSLGPGLHSHVFSTERSLRRARFYQCPIHSYFYVILHARTILPPLVRWNVSQVISHNYAFFGDRRFRAAFRRFSIQKEYVAQNNTHEMGGAFPASGAKYVLSFAHAFLSDKPGRPLHCLDRGSMHGGESAKVGEMKFWEQELDAWDRLLRRVPQPFTLKLSQIFVYSLDLDTVPENGHLPPCGGPGI